MNVLTDQPANLNQLSQLNYRMMIRRSPSVSYFCYQANIPGISLPAAKEPTAFVDIPQPGDKLEFDPLMIRFKVDEDLVNYFDIHSWMRKTARADDFREYAELAANPQESGLGVKSDIVIAYLDSDRNPNLMLTYYDAFPIRLSQLAFNAQDSDVQTLSADVIFRYINYDYEWVKTGITLPANYPNIS